MSFLDNIWSPKKQEKKVREITYMVKSGRKSSSSIIDEQMKGEVDRVIKKFPAELGENVIEHPLKIEFLEKWYKDDPFTNGFVDKLVDAIVSGGFFVRSDDARAEKIAKDFIRDHHFNPLLKNWIRNAIITGNGYLEMSGEKDTVPDEFKVLDSKSMYIRRAKTGEIEGFVQWRGPKSREDPIPFEPHEIAHYAHKKVGDSAYGIGAIFPLTYTLNKKSKLLSDMCLLMSRKANAPIVAKMGRLGNTPDEDIVPNESKMTAFGKKMEWMNNKHEWTVNPYIDLSVLDFGKIGDKFKEPLNLINDELYFGSQVPAVLMGQARIPEGLAKAQTGSFTLRVKSIQEEIEKVIEEKIFKRLMIAHKIQAHVEFEWGEPSQEDKNKEIKTITDLLKLYKDMAISEGMRDVLEEKLAELMNLKITETPEKEKERELEEPQPRVPGQNRPELRFMPHIEEGMDVKKDYSIREWVDFNYRDYLDDIEIWINSPEYDLYLAQTLRATTTSEVKMGLLTNNQITRMKSVLIDDFKRDRSINQIAKNLREKVKLKGLSIPQQLDKDGNIIRRAYNMDVESRSIMLARTEVTKTSNEGALLNFTRKGVERYQWVASPGARTCPICENLDGTSYIIGQGPVPQAHANCRCTVVPFISEKVKKK